MVDDKITALAAEFSRTWTTVFTEYPMCRLDGTWPSMGIVDHLLFPLRRKASLTEAQSIFLQGAAAYIGHAAYDCWSSFPDEMKITLSLRLRDKPEFELRARGGRLLKEGESFQVPIRHALEETLAEPKNPFPAFADGMVRITMHTNIVGLLCRGLMSGLCPAGRGPWSGRPAAEFGPYVRTVCRKLGEQTAEYYARCFPSEPLGSVARLYVNHLILPPPGQDEQFPCVRATAGLIDYLRSIDAEPAQMSALAVNLAAMPDELIAGAGFALAAALYEDHPSPRLQALAELHGPGMNRLRPAYLLARKMLRKRSNWPEAVYDGAYEDAARLMRTEQDLNLAPLLTVLRPEKWERGFIGKAMESLSWTNIQAAYDCFSLADLGYEWPPDFFLQYAGLAAASGKHDYAEELLGGFSGAPPAGDSELAFEYFRLQALIARSRGEKEPEASFLRLALEQDSTRSLSATECELRLCSLLAAGGAEEEAFERIAALCEKRPHSGSARIALYALRKASGDEEGARDELRRLAPVAASSIRVFSIFREELAGRLLQGL